MQDIVAFKPAALPGNCSFQDRQRFQRRLESGATSQITTGTGPGRESAAELRLEVRSVDQLLNPEASPFPGPRLVPEAGERILKMARTSSRAAGLVVELTVPAADLGRGDEVRRALDVLAREAMEDAEKELREIFRNQRARRRVAPGVLR